MLASPTESRPARSDVLRSTREISPPPLRRSQKRPEPPVQASPAQIATAETSPHDSPRLPSRAAKASSLAPFAGNADTQWTKSDLAKALRDMSKDMQKAHSKLVTQAIEGIMPVERRIQQGADLFGALTTQSCQQAGAETMRVKFKQHLKSRKEQRQEHHRIVIILSTEDRVPPYRFHQVNIKKNILTPHTMLTFVPHLRDLETSEEVQYNMWLKELEDSDKKSGFTPMSREEKVVSTIQSERAATVSLFIDGWLRKLAIPNVTKSALVTYITSQKSNDKTTSQKKKKKKTNVARVNHDTDENILGVASNSVILFSDAFKQAFEHDVPLARKIELRQVLMQGDSTAGLLLGDSAEGFSDPRPSAKENAPNPQFHVDEATESHVATYSILGCLICGSHSCEHGEFDIKNFKRTFGLSSVRSLAKAQRLRRQRFYQENLSAVDPPGCRRGNCSATLSTSTRASQMLEWKPWKEDEVALLRSIYASLIHNARANVFCMTAEILDRECDDVRAKFESLNWEAPAVFDNDPQYIKSLSWYDNHKKILIGDWKDHTLTHDHNRRVVIEPCSHEGSCSAQNCSCIKARVLCEKWCKCNVKTCPYKFSGCGCHSDGKSCLPKQKQKTCICVELNRECDPDLCGSCGAEERADPSNAEWDRLYETGCQNCELQRGKGKSVVLGKSQLDGVGYGLFTAENIAQDDFVIEYVGELITHDEGERRAARHGDVFDKNSSTSYVFTLLDNDGISVDALIYGNLSRYINHADEQNRTCNMIPCILYVNGEYRIKFTATRDIAVSEELFFNYGVAFPNVTKKLPDAVIGERKEAVRQSEGPRELAESDNINRKASTREQSTAAAGKKPRSRRSRQSTATYDEDYKDDGRDRNTDEDLTARGTQRSPLNRSTKRKREVETQDLGSGSPFGCRNSKQGYKQGSTAENDDLRIQRSTPSRRAGARRSLCAGSSEISPKAINSFNTLKSRGSTKRDSEASSKHFKVTAEASAAGNSQGTPTRTLPGQGESVSLRPTSQSRTSGAPDAAEIRDSQEWSTGGEEEANEAGEANADAKGQRGDNGRQNRRVNGEDGRVEEDDLDLIVGLLDRPARKRRRPAKFREEDL